MCIASLRVFLHRRWLIPCVTALCVSLMSPWAFAQNEPASSEPLLFIGNDQIRIGLKKESGGAIAWVSQGATGENLVDSYDRGRLIQQSYYGNADGSLWNKKPWRWNPVQGGDWHGTSAKVLEIEHTPASAYVKTLPKHWASGADVTTATMEQWITFEGPVARIKFRFEQKGGENHTEHEQEIPAVFLRPDLHWLVLYNGDKPWTDAELDRTKPGWPNERRKITEHWAAYVDDRDNGIGVYVPVSDHLTCYRFGKDEKARGSCSYFAPLIRFAIQADYVWEYEAFITIGSVKEIRERFKALAQASERTKP